MTSEILVAKTTVQTTVDGQEVRIVAGKTTVRAGHPILDGREDLFEPLVPTYEVGSEDADEQGDPEEQAGDTGYDPAEHTVDEVNTYLADAELAERELVLQAEAEGQARKGILTGPYSDLSGLD